MKHCYLIILLGALYLAFAGISPANGETSRDKPITVQFVRAIVLHNEVKQNEQILRVKLSSSQFKGQVLELSYTPTPGSNIVVYQEDEVIVRLETDGEQIKNAYISDYGRDRILFYLAVSLVLILFIVGGKKGMKSIFSLAIAGASIFFVMLPLIFQGCDPIMITIIVSAAITVVTLIIIGGFSVKTLAAIIGTISGVLIAGELAYVIGTAAQITGFSEEEMQELLFIPQQISFDYRGILFAGMIIGALGAVMDVGMSVASAIEEIKRANPYLKTVDLIKAGMNVGRDIMGTMANTLILAYTGGAIPLMLIFMAYNTPFIRLINLDLIATEVVRAITGSIGLILAIPVTSIVAGVLYGFWE